MKTVTFFSEKGGVGKTTLLTMFASWLAYSQEERVRVLDFDYPSYQMYGIRENDKFLYNKPENRVLIQEASKHMSYPVNKINWPDTLLHTQREYDTLVRNLREQKDKLGDGYLILDFPGHFLSTDPSYHVIMSGMMDLIVFLVDSDRQSRTSVFNVYKMLRENPATKNQDILVLWNREHSDERRQQKAGKRTWYDQSNEMFAMFGIPVISRRMRDILIARRDANTFGFIRCSLCWPEMNIRQKCPYIVDIFSEVKSRLDGTWVDRPFVHEDEEP